MVVNQPFLTIIVLHSNYNTVVTLTIIEHFNYNRDPLTIIAAV